jgi:hypothetical protein
VTTSQAIKILEAHNKWRQGADTPMQKPSDITRALEVVIDVLKNRSKK